MAKVRDESGKEPSKKIILDTERYKEKEKQALKENIEYIIANYPILGKENKIMRVRLRTLIEHELQYETTEEDGKITEGSDPGDSDPGDGPSQDLLEINTSAKELLEMLIEDLEMIELIHAIEEEIKNAKDKFVPVGKSKTGSSIRLNKKATAKQKIGRCRATGKTDGYQPSDKRFRILNAIPDKELKAVIFLVMDTSGSMGDDKKFLARAFYGILVYCLQKMYSSVDIIFISQTDKASEREEEEFFSLAESGGTNISTGPKKVLEIIHQRYNTEGYDIFAWIATDGENTHEDNPKLLDALKELCEITRLTALCEINPNKSMETISKLGGIKKLQKDFAHFVVAKLFYKNQIKNILKKCLENAVRQ